MTDQAPDLFAFLVQRLAEVYARHDRAEQERIIMGDGVRPPSGILARLAETQPAEMPMQRRRSKRRHGTAQ